MAFESFETINRILDVCFICDPIKSDFQKKFMKNFLVSFKRRMQESII